MDDIPAIDLSRPDGASLRALNAACEDHGFFLITGHGCDDLIDRTWDVTRRFFDQPHARKRAVVRSEDNALGYFDRELTKRRRDCKEVFDFMQPHGSIGLLRNRWPSEPADFRETLTAYFDEFGRIAGATLALIHSALGLEPGAMEEHRGSARTSTGRLNHYPVEDPVPVGQRAELSPLADVALGHHTDPGVLTLLLQDDTGGLQTLSRAGDWIDVPPTPGTIVVNVSDVLRVWSNDRYRASIHRVGPMTSRSRYSIPYFFNPELESVIEPIDALLSQTAEAARYRSFTWREFIRARIDDNYADLGVDDTQADHYRIT